MKVKAGKRFVSIVFGADDFIKNFPEIMTTGVDVKKIGDYYYVMIDGKPVHDSTSSAVGFELPGILWRGVYSAVIRLPDQTYAQANQAEKTKI